jgi:hypothetical protein
MRTIVTSGLAAMAVATFLLAPVASAWAAGDCGWGSHATRTASTTVDTTTAAPQTPIEQPKSGG